MLIFDGVTCNMLFAHMRAGQTGADGSDDLCLVENRAIV